MSKHSELSGAQLHEPKHIVGSVVGDAGKVITPSGSGASMLRYLTPSEVGINTAYGELKLAQNTNINVVSLSSSLYDTAEYVHVDVAGMSLGEANGVSYNSSLRGLQVGTSGTYRVTFWANVSSDTADSAIGIKLKQAGSWVSLTAKTDAKTVGRAENLAGSCILSLNADDTITLWVASDKAATIKVEDFRLDATLLEG